MMQIAELIKKYQLHEKDTGSTAVQIILLSEQIEKLKSHRSPDKEKNKKDVPAKRALTKKNALRKKFYNYLVKSSPELFQKLQKEHEWAKFLGIKVKKTSDNK